MDGFVKVFDIADSGFKSIGFATFGFVFIGIGLVMFFSPKILIKFNLQKTKEETKFQKIFRYFFLGFSLCWTGTALFSTYGEYVSLRDTDCRIVEGKIENFDPMPYSGHKDETYSVQGVRFSYSDYGVTNGFNNTVSHGGPVNQYSVVRICYVPRGSANIITKLEVKDYKGDIKDYSVGFGFFEKFKQLEKDEISVKHEKEMKTSDKAMDVAMKYMFFIFPMYLADFVLYVFLFIPFYSTFFKLKDIEHTPIEVDKKILDHEKHTFENFTVRYDGEYILWGRSYGIELLNTPGLALKMYLSRDKASIVRSEIRISSLMCFTLLIFAFVGFRFFEVAIDNSSDATGAIRYFPFVVFPVIAINFWILKVRFQKKIDQLFKKVN